VETPFDQEWIETTTIYTPTSGDKMLVEAAFKRVPMAVSQYRRIKFVAQDPQAEDDVTILLLEDPGIVKNLNVGRSLVSRTIPYNIYIYIYIYILYNVCVYIHTDTHTHTHTNTHTQCVERSRDEPHKGMCRAVDIIDPWRYPHQCCIHTHTHTHAHCV
jgi:hypothetical protein